MIFKNEEEVIAFIESHKQTEQWVTNARDHKKELAALVRGEKFLDILISRIEKIESVDRQSIRKKYSKDIRDMFDRTMQPRDSIFSASGGSVRLDFKNKTKQDEFISILSHLKGGRSIKRYLSDYFWQMSDIDPNGIIYMEYVNDEKIYPTYKSINDIRYYESDGQALKVLMFEPKPIIELNKSHNIKHRVVDERKEWAFYELSTGVFELIEDETFEHPFNGIPAFVLSPWQKLGCEYRYSNLNSIEELSKDYARDKSILTAYKFMQGFPRHWRYEKTCRTCQGTGKVGNEVCESCSGQGYIRNNDVTDVTIINEPFDKDDPVLAPNLEGFVSPDLETWRQYKDDLRDNEDQIDATMWGTRRLQESKGGETATGRFIDVQPVQTKLNVFADIIEEAHNFIAHRVEDWMNGKPKEAYEYHKSYGRRFIIESPDTLLEKYVEAREKGAGTSILDEKLEEYIISQNKNNQVAMDEMLKKAKVEPYVHYSIDQVSNIFGRNEANKKVMFRYFWESLDKNVILSKTEEDLTKDFNTYYEHYKMEEPNQQSNS